MFVAPGLRRVFVAVRPLARQQVDAFRTAFELRCNLPEKIPHFMAMLTTVN